VCCFITTVQTVLNLYILITFVIHGTVEHSSVAASYLEFTGFITAFIVICFIIIATFVVLLSFLKLL